VLFRRALSGRCGIARLETGEKFHLKPGEIFVPSPFASFRIDEGQFVVRFRNLGLLRTQSLTLGAATYKGMYRPPGALSYRIHFREGEITTILAIPKWLLKNGGELHWVFGNVRRVWQRL
jgi:hypothetical protein